MDITENNHGGNENSIEAFASVKGKMASQAATVLSLFANHGNASTTDELEARYCEVGDKFVMRRQTLTARISDLRWNSKVVKATGFGLIDTGEKRETRNKKNAEVSRVIPYEEWVKKDFSKSPQAKRAAKIETSILISALEKRGYAVVSVPE